MREMTVSVDRLATLGAAKVPELVRGPSAGSPEVGSMVDLR